MLNSGSTRSPHAADASHSLAHALLRLGVRQLAVLRATSASIACAPTLDDAAGSIERTREALLALERSAELYLTHSAGSLLADAGRMLGELLAPESWVDATRAQLLLCLATQVELTQAREQGEYDPHALASATEHVHAARAALHEAGAFGQPLHANQDPSSARWLTLALGTLPDERARTAYMQALEQTSSGLAH